MTIRRLILTAILVCLLVGSFVQLWGPALARSLGGDPNGAAQLHLIEGLLMAVGAALIVTAGTGRIWPATMAGTAAAGLTIGLRPQAWSAPASGTPFQTVTATLAAAVLVSFIAAASLRVAMDAIREAWQVWVVGSRWRDRLPALVPILGVFLVALSLTSAPDLARQVHSPSTILSAPVAGPVLPAPDAPVARSAGQIVRDGFYSTSMRRTRIFDVYLPPSYDLQTAQHRSYPVLYLLHGDDANVDSWPSFGLREIVDARIAAGSLPEMLVVMPDGSGVLNDETDWANRWDGTEPIEDQVIELVGVVDDTYRTLADRSFRFIGGFSSGGFGALNIALQYPDLFSVSMSFSGFIAADDPAVDPGVFGTSPAYIARNSPAVLVGTVPQAVTLYYVLSAGAHDLYFQARMRAFEAQLTGLGFAHEFHVVDGAHDPDAWTAGLGYGLDYLGRVLLRPSDSSTAR